MYGEYVSYLSALNPAARIEEPGAFWEVLRVDGTQLRQGDSQKRPSKIL
jgi:hypothetical protein